MGADRIVFDDDRRPYTSRSTSRCSAQGCRGPGFFLCDHVDASGQLCGRRICGHHRTVRDGLDYCRLHAQVTAPTMGLRCSTKGCFAVAPLPCSSADCPRAVCGRCAGQRGGQYVCSSCHVPTQGAFPFGGVQ